MDIRELSESLDLRSYGRLITSDHPFFSQIKDLLNASDFFKVEMNACADQKLKNSLRLLNVNRNKVLSWPIANVLTNSALRTILSNMLIGKLLTRQGKLSLHYFAIHQRAQHPRVKDLTINEFRTIERFIEKPELRRILGSLIGNRVAYDLRFNDKEVYVSSNGSILNISTMSSGSLRRNQAVDEDKIICLYKIGLALDPGEVLSWTNQLKKLTSTRHKNIILRVAHGDIFSNSRLCKFGLRDTANCANCPEAVETIQHRIMECPLALETWHKVKEAKQALGLQAMTDFSIENLLGAKDRMNKVELAINAEVLHKLTSRGDRYCPDQVVKAALKLISNSEPMAPELKRSFKDLLNS